jgi:hypothetical protein
MYESGMSRITSPRMCLLLLPLSFFTLRFLFFVLGDKVCILEWRHKGFLEESSGFIFRIFILGFPILIPWIP